MTEQVPEQLLKLEGSSSSDEESTTVLDHVTAEALRSIRRGDSCAPAAAMAGDINGEFQANSRSDNGGDGADRADNDNRIVIDSLHEHADATPRKKRKRITSSTSRRLNNSSSNSNSTSALAASRSPIAIATTTVATATPVAPTRTRRRSTGSAATATARATAAITNDTNNSASPGAKDGVLAAFLATQAFVSPRDFFVQRPLALAATATAAASPDANASASAAETDRRHVTCTLCQMAISSRAYTLKRHLFRHHREVFRLEQSAASAGTGVRSGDTNVSVQRDTTTKDSSKHTKRGSPKSTIRDTKDTSDATTTTGEIDGCVELASVATAALRKSATGAAQTPMADAFVAWLRADVVPLPALASAHFRAFVREANAAFAVPDVRVEPRRQRQSSVGEATQPDDASDSGGASSNARGATTGRDDARRVMRGLWLQSASGSSGSASSPPSSASPSMPTWTLRSDVPVPEPRAGEALVRVLRAGICGTDLMMLGAYKPNFCGVFGHEFVGIVEQIGIGSDDRSTTRDTNLTKDIKTIDGTSTTSPHDEFARQWLGQRVVGEINVPCDACSTCRAAASGDRARVRRRNHCPQRAALGIVRQNGAFAEFLTLPLANLHVVPPDVVDAHAVFAEPLAAACRVVEQHAVARGDRVIVLGDGKLGLLVAEVLQAQGVARSVALVGKHTDKLELLLVRGTSIGGSVGTSSGTNTTSTINTNTVVRTHLLEDVQRADSPLIASFDVCVECTGTPAGATLALRLLRRGGTVVMKSTCAAARSPIDTALVHATQARVLGSRCGPFDAALALLRDRRVDVQKFIDGVYPLARADAALAHAAQRGALKIQFVVS